MQALRAPCVFDGTRFLRGGATVVVDDGRIVGVESADVPLPDGCAVASYDGATLLPGLIDTHVHLVGDSEVGALDRLGSYRDDELDAVVDEALRRQLAAGVTTVRDLGDRHFCVAERRASITSQQPTIVASGPPLTTVGGHCWNMGGEVAGRADIERAIAERAERAVDVVKVMASGGFLTPGTALDQRQFADDDMRLIVDRAHAAGLPVTAHAHALAAVRQAVAAGVDGIEHCSCLTRDGFAPDHDLLAVIAQSGIPVSTTMGIEPGKVFPPPRVLAALAEHGWNADELLAGREAFLRRMCASGIRLVCGADSGIGSAKPHGVLPISVAEHVRHGLPIELALAGATSFAAEACGLGARKGRLRQGFDADLLIVAGDLAADVSALRHPVKVLLGQRV